MEKIKKPNLSSFSKDFKLKLYAGIFAVLIWIILAVTQYPSLTTTINNISLKEINTDGTTAADYQLNAVGEIDQLFSVKINGFRGEIGSLSSEDLEAYVDIQGITKPGEYDLPVEIKPKKGIKFNVEEIIPKTVKVKFDTFIEKEFSVEPDATSISASSGFIMEEVKATPDKVKVYGPKQDIEKITKAVLRTDKKASLSESQIISDASLILYNGDTIMDISQFTLNNSYFNIEVPIFMKKTLPLKLTIRNTPPNFNLSSLKYEQSERTIDIAAPNNLIADLGEKHLGYVDLSTIDIGKQFTFNAPLESSYKNLSGIETVTVKFPLENYSSKIISLKRDQFHIINAPSDYTVKIKTSAIYNVKIIGPTNVINQISSSDFIAEIDMLDASLNEATYTRPVSVYSPKYNNVWAFGEYSLTLEVNKN